MTPETPEERAAYLIHNEALRDTQRWDPDAAIALVAREIRMAEQATIERCAAVAEVVAEKLYRDHPDASPGYGAWSVRTHILTLAAQRRTNAESQDNTSSPTKGEEGGE